MASQAQLCRRGSLLLVLLCDIAVVCLHAITSKEESKSEYGRDQSIRKGMYAGFSCSSARVSGIGVSSSSAGVSIISTASQLADVDYGLQGGYSLESVTRL